ncbi:MAG: NUDIX hydrolase [Chloroflexi bacterium]|nr:NUDIX hydrolase [Chloroflexota bacterium]
MTVQDNYPRLQPDGEHLVYESPWLDVYHDDIVHPDGKPGSHVWVKGHSGNGAVMTIPVTPSGQYLLIRVYRHPIKRHLWEFPAGLIEDGESALEAGRRELVEETGVTPTDLVLLGSQVPIAGYVADIFHSVLAEIPEISIDDVRIQVDEGITEARLLSRRELVRLIGNGEIGDGVTLTCLARYWAYHELNQANEG